MNPAVKKALELLQKTGNFLAPRVTAAGSGALNTAGMLKDFVEYNSAGDSKNKQKQLQEYNQKRTAASQALKMFGFDDTKKGNQFSPTDYGRGVLAGGGEAASYASPLGGGLKARMAINAVPGITDAIGNKKGIGGIAGEGLMTSLLGTGGEKAIKGVGALIKGGGNKLTSMGENLGLRKFGLTKLDVNKLEKEFGMKLPDFLKEQGLVGKGAEDLGQAIEPLQKSFNDIAENSGLQVDENKLFKMFTDKIDELKASNAPELRAKAAQLEEYVTNLFTNNAQDLSGKGVTGERRIIDQLVKDFENSGDAVGASKNRVVRDILQQSIRDEAEKQGIKGVGGKSLAGIGDELKKLYSFAEVAGKRTPQPTGSPMGLLKSVLGGSGATVGAVTGGLPGAIVGGVAGLAADNIANNPKVIQKVAQNLPQIGSNIAQTGANIGGNETMQKLMQILGVKSGEGISSLLAPNGVQVEAKQNQNAEGAPNNIQNSVITPNKNQNIPQPQQMSSDPLAGDDGNWVAIDANGNPTNQKVTFQELQQQGAFQAPGQEAQQQAPISDEQFQQLFIADLMQTGGKNFDKLSKLQQVISPQEDLDTQLKQVQLAQAQQNLTKEKPKTEAQIARDDTVRIAQDAMNDLSNKNINIGFAGTGALLENAKSKFDKGDPDTLAFNQKVAAVKASIAKARAGTSFTPNEEKLLNQYTPRVGDSRQTLEIKLAGIQQLFANKQDAVSSDPTEVLQMLGIQ